MSRERFQAREKKVQKMGRDGLVEHNRATGEEKRVSQRTADAAFDRARPTEREDIRRPAVRGADTGKKRKQPRPAPETRAEQTEVLLTPEYLADATAEPPPDAPATMRGAVDMPLLDAPAAEEPTPAPVRKRPQKRGKKGKKKQSTKFAEHAARPDSEEKTAMRGVEGAPAPKRRTSEGGSRLQFDLEEEPADTTSDRTAIRKRQLADESHISIKEIADIEKGRRNPSYLIMKTLAKVLHFSLDSLIRPELTPDEAGQNEMKLLYLNCPPEMRETLLSHTRGFAEELKEISKKLEKE